jgi:hypothetical protein
MAELFGRHERCPSCKYWADISEWSALSICATGGVASLICKKYRPEARKHHHLGSVELIACPECKTIIWHKQTPYINA